MKLTIIFIILIILIALTGCTPEDGNYYKTSIHKKSKDHDRFSYTTDRLKDPFDFYVIKDNKTGEVYEILALRFVNFSFHFILN